MVAGWDFSGARGAGIAWAKFDGERGATMSVAQHLADTASMAAWLWDNFFARHVTSMILAAAGDKGRLLYIWLAGLHDLGKLSVGFSGQILDAPGGELVLNRQRDAGLDATRRAGATHRPRHELVSQIALQDWIEQQWPPAPDEFGIITDRPEALPSVVGAHHGRTSNYLSLKDAREALTHEADAWALAREELIDVVTDELDVRDLVSGWIRRQWPGRVLVMLNAMVIVADWMASNIDAFPYAGIDEDRLARAVDVLQIPPPWASVDAGQGVAELFETRFPSLPGAANEMQVAVVEACRAATEPPLLIIEGPTGSGKSEAMMTAAEILAAKFGCGGVFVGMPTMATGNGMFARITDWISHLPDAHIQSVALAHSKASLNEDYERLRPSRFHDVSRDGGEQSDVATAVAVEWFAGRKRHLLASFSVGTIDQLLMAGVTAKHVVLRHLALAGKVVVLDEIHAADDVQRVFLIKVLGWLGAYRTPVILMSATLPPDQRRELLHAYARGRDPRLNLEDPQLDSELAESAYPRVTLWGRHVDESSTKSDPLFTRDVRLDALPSGGDALVELLRDRISDGGCVAVIRNTVRRAQETYACLKEQFGDEVELLHSRFLAVDRVRRERVLVRELGRAGSRPQRKVIVATQVIEQSLDLDFDLMVTDLAPVDLVIQRMGRLHRHILPEGARPLRVGQPQCWIDGLPVLDGEPQVDPGSARVYDRGLLLRAAVVLGPLCGTEIALPEVVPTLVARAYAADFDPPPAWREVLRAADRRRQQVRERKASELSGRVLEDSSVARRDLIGFLNGAEADGGATELDGKAASRVRDGEESFEVVVVRRDTEGLRPLAHTSIGDRLLPTMEAPEPRVARELATHTITLPAWLCRVRRDVDGATVDVLQELERDGLAAWQASPWLRGQLVLALDGSGVRALGNHVLRYDIETGMSVEEA